MRAKRACRWVAEASFGSIEKRGVVTQQLAYRKKVKNRDFANAGNLRCDREKTDK